MRRIPIDSPYLFKKITAITPETSIAEEIVSAVRREGDRAVREYTLKYDDVQVDRFRVDREDIEKASEEMSDDLRSSLKTALENLHCFSRRQLLDCRDFELEICPGVTARQHVIPIDRIGIYVPGGRYPLISSVLMAAVPAQAAGVKEIALCSPPGKEGRLPSELLAAAGTVGVHEIYRMGGAQAVAAMAYGTDSVKPVDKIVGPGNVYVNAAKRLVYGDVGIDFVAGPTEILIIADASADADLIAADLIAQAEHDPVARPMLISLDEGAADAVELRIEARLNDQKPGSPARTSLQDHGLILLARDIGEAAEAANLLAPEHLQLVTADPQAWTGRLRHFGSLFTGKWAAEVLGDYCSGLNHILPTGRAARYCGALNVRDFLKFQTGLEVDSGGLRRIGPAAACLAGVEGLEGHARAVKARLDRLKRQSSEPSDLT